MNPIFLAEVAFPIPLRRVFDYRVPSAMSGSLRPGHRVWAPFGKRARRMGLLLRLHEPEAGGMALDALKELAGPVEPTPVLNERDLALAHWMSDRYSCSLGEALFTVFPLGQRRPPRRPPRDIARTGPPPSPLSPTREQADALATLLPAVRSGEHRRFLLHGVAASGKTEIYRHAVASALKVGRGALLLVPEIGLTPQMENRLRGVFGDDLDLWHSGLSDGERWRVWRRVREGRARVIVGPRSALFLPVSPLGIIIVDEEHDASYKQDQRPSYHARDTAEEKARLHGAVLLLGSATPSLESHRRAREGNPASSGPDTSLQKIVLSRRVENRPFPIVRLVDMRRESWYFSDALIAALRDRLGRGEQSMVFLNRRGYSTHLECLKCGWVAQCPQCRVGLVVHRAASDRTVTAPPILRCHTCEHAQALSNTCPQCGGEALKTSGRGTQRVASDLSVLFPTARCLRWDRDATAGRLGHERMYQEVMAGKADLIVGTQMIAQGHDFPNLTLVGVLDADRSLSFPDFRAAERTFQLLMQVAGRAGRAERPGEVILQTRTPDHYALRAVAERSYDAFASNEMDYRQDAGYPPFTRVVHAILRAKTDAAAEESADALIRWLEEAFVPRLTDDRLPPTERTVFLGPAPAFHRAKAGWSHWQVVIKAPPRHVPEILSRANAFVPPAGAGLSLDVDPEGMG